jgi:hypothetical protein
VRGVPSKRGSDADRCGKRGRNLEAADLAAFQCSRRGVERDKQPDVRRHAEPLHSVAMPCQPIAANSADLKIDGSSSSALDSASV